MILSFKKSAIYLLIFCVGVFQIGCKSNADEKLREGIEKFENADFTGAAKFFSEIIEKDSTNVVAYFKLASSKACIHKNMKLFEMDWRKAMLRSKPDLRNNKDNGTVRKTIYDTNPLRSDEIESFNEAIKKNPENADLYFGRGLWYFNEHYMDGNKAISDFTSAISINKKFTEAYLMRGRTYLYYVRNNELPNRIVKGGLKAVLDFKRALSLEPENKETLYEIGNAYVMAGRHQAAIVYLNRLLQLDPENIHALSLRSFCKTIVQDYSVAIKDYDILVSKFPREASYLEARGIQKIMYGYKEEGLTDLRKANLLTKDPGLKNEIKTIIDKYSSGRQ